VKPLSLYFCALFAIPVFASNNIESPEYHFAELQEILLQVEDYAPIFKEQKESIDIAKANTIFAKSAQGSHVKINLQGQSIHEDRPDQPYSGRERFFGSISIRKPLFHWGALRSQSSISVIQEAITLNNLKYFLNDLKANVRTSYLEMFVLSKQVEIARSSLQNAEENFIKIKGKNELGLSSDIVVKNENIELLKQKILLEDINRSLESAKKSFIQLTGWSEALNFEENNNSFTTLQVDHAFGESLPVLLASHSSRVTRQINHEIKVEKNRLTIAKSGLKPKVNLVGAFYQDQVPLADDSFTRNNAVVGLEVNWAIWDSSKSKAEKLKSLANKRKLELSLERESRSFRLEIENMRAQLDSLAKRVEMTRQLVVLSEKKLSISKTELESDRITPAQFMDAQMALNRSKIQRLQSVCDYIKMRNRYEASLTTSYE
jgi:outer membrane protein TolC